MKIKLAFAVNEKNEFEERHFGDTYKFLIYEFNNGAFTLVSEQINIYKNLPHGTKNKGDSITELLKKHDTNVLISMQFGRNLAIVNKSFIPVIVSRNTPSEAMDIIKDKIHWIEDELNNNTSNYNLFTINTGIMKSKIEE
jgi:predicted Fe-Mo cluster-binding NifX family protein